MFQCFVIACARPLLFCWQTIADQTKYEYPSPPWMLTHFLTLWSKDMLAPVCNVPNTPIHNKGSMGVDMKGILGFMPQHEPQVPVRHEPTSPLLFVYIFSQEFLCFPQQFGGQGTLLPRKSTLAGLLAWATSMPQHEPQGLVRHEPTFPLLCVQLL